MGGPVPEASPALGAFVEEFGRSETVRKQYGIIAAVGYGLGVAFFVPGAWLPGAIFLALGVFMTWGFWRQRGVRVRIYERGFTFTRGRRTLVFPWEEIEVFSESQQVYREALTGYESGVGYQYFIRRRDGRTLRMDNEVKGVAEVGARLREETRRWLLARALELVNRGEAANFGPLAVTREGLVRGGRHLPWAEVGRVDLSDDGKLVAVDRAGRTWSEDLHGFVPNAHVLLALAQRVRKEAVGRQ